MTPSSSAGQVSGGYRQGEDFPEELTHVDRDKGERFHFWPHILPGGKAALFSVLTTDSEIPHIEVVSLETGEQRTLLENGGIGAHFLPSVHIVYSQLGTLTASGFDCPTRAHRDRHSSDRRPPEDGHSCY